MKTVLCFGNEAIEEDNLALNLADEMKLDNVKFVKCKGEDVINHKLNKDIYIMDVAKGIEEVKLIDDPDKLVDRNTVTAHDFDLSFFLKLAKETNKIKKLNIIAIPQKGDKEKIKSDIIKLLEG
ncbi:MAG: hypothetical protein GY861_07020 [bacterium]|nr:hypothetical protein [bacterium]